MCLDVFFQEFSLRGFELSTTFVTGPQFCKFSFLLIIKGLVIWPRLGDPFVCQNLIGVYLSHSSGQILGCAYTICSYGQISLSSRIPSGSTCSTSHCCCCCCYYHYYYYYYYYYYYCYKFTSGPTPKQKKNYGHTKKILSTLFPSNLKKQNKESLVKPQSFFAFLFYNYFICKQIL